MQMQDMLNEQTEAPGDALDNRLAVDLSRLWRVNPVPTGEVLPKVQAPIVSFQR